MEHDKITNYLIYTRFKYLEDEAFTSGSQIHTTKAFARSVLKSTIKLDMLMQDITFYYQLTEVSKMKQ